MSIYDDRLTRAKQAMAASGIDIMLVVPGPAMRYFSGFSESGYERLLCLVLARTQDPLFITPALNAAQVSSNPAQIKNILAWDDTQGWQTLLSEVVNERSPAAIGVDDDMAARFLLPLQQMSPGVKYIGAGDLLAGMRCIKDTQELEWMHEAGNITDSAIADAYSACIEGATELEVKRAIVAAISRAGGELGFEPIVGSGPNSALPHHSAGTRRIQNGDVVVLDFGARFIGYCGDITRTICIGAPDPEAYSVYDIVLTAQREALNTIAPGVTAESVDAAAREVIEQAGYGQYFIHRTGHGIGLEDHEAPNIVAGNRTLLQPGMCFSIEPGVYLPGRFGVRLEVIVTVTPSGYRSFNRANEPNLSNGRNSEDI